MGPVVSWICMNVEWYEILLRLCLYRCCGGHFIYTSQNYWADSHPYSNRTKNKRKTGVPKEKMVGIRVQKGGISRALEELMVQPLLASVSVLTLATETVWSILHMDDVNAQ